VPSTHGRHTTHTHTHCDDCWFTCLPAEITSGLSLYPSESRCSWITLKPNEWKVDAMMKVRLAPFGSDACVRALSSLAAALLNVSARTWCAGTPARQRRTWPSAHPGCSIIVPNTLRGVGGYLPCWSIKAMREHRVWVLPLPAGATIASGRSMYAVAALSCCALRAARPCHPW
jgi:hypothetical protein